MYNDKNVIKTQEEIDAEKDLITEYSNYSNFGSGFEAEDLNGTKAPAGPVYENPPTFEPADVPGLDSNDIPEEQREVFRGDNGENNPLQVKAEITESLEEPNKPEEIKLPQTEKEESEPSSEETDDEIELATTNNNTNIAPAAPQDSDDTTVTITPQTQVDNSTDVVISNNGGNGPIFCPYCKQELFQEAAKNGFIYCHHAEQTAETGCDEIFVSLNEIEETEQRIQKKEEQKRALEEYQQEKAKRKEEEEDALAQQTKEKVEQAPASQSISPEVYLIFSNQLSGVIKTLAEIQARLAKLDALAEELTDIKKQLEALKEGKESLNLPETSAKLEKATQTLSEAQTKIQENLAVSTDLKQTIGELKEGGKDLLAITDNAGEQFYQYINAVKQLEKYNTRIKFVLPRIEEYLKVLESCYENLTRRYSKEQRDFGEHFKKQTQSFFKEASKKMVFVQTTASAPSIASMIIPTIAAFILMFLLHILTK